MADGNTLLTEFRDALLDIVVSKDKDLPTVLAHYTTTDGLLSMMEKSELWFSDARFLSDTTELNYGIRLMEEIFEGRQRQLRDAGILASMSFHGHPLRGYLIDTFSNAISPYIFCLCENANQLSQWRSYSNTRGYSICFLARELLRLKPDLRGKSPDQTFLCKVVYEEDKQREIAEAVVGVIIQFAKRLKQVPPLPGETELPLSFLVMAAKGMLDCVIQFKDSCFQEEQEWRVYCWIAKDDQNLLSYRNKADLILPYLVMKNPNEEHLLPINGIYFSSSSDEQMRDKGLRMLCYRYGYRNVSVIANGLPPFR